MRPGGIIHPAPGERPLTLADALGCASRPLAGVVATWRSGPRWRRRAVRAVYPGLARALDDLAAGIENVLGPL
jgi:hypothetical protein